MGTYAGVLIAVVAVPICRHLVPACLTASSIAAYAQSATAVVTIRSPLMKPRTTEQVTAGGTPDEP